MSEIGDESDDVRRLREALELRPDEIDVETRERHLARALDEFDDSPSRVVPLRRRRFATVAAAAAVVLAIVGVGAVIASRGHDGSSTTRAEAPATSLPPTSAKHDVLGRPAESTSGPDGFAGASTAAASIGDFPTVDAVRAAALANIAVDRPNQSGAAAPVTTTEVRAPGVRVECSQPPLDGGRVVARVSASVAGEPVTVWIVDRGGTSRHAIIVNDATCTVRSS
jgi:hypothetical protein